MSKNVYQEYNEDALSYYGLEGTLYGVPTSEGGYTIEPVLFTDNEKVYEQIKTDLGNHTIDIFGTHKKAFMLPKSPVSIARVKAACKEHGILITNNYHEADLIITHENFHLSFNDGQSIQKTILLAKMWNYETIGSDSRSVQVKDFCNENNCRVIYDSKFSFDLWNENYDALMEGWLITGMAINLAHHIKVNSLPVIKVQECLSQSANTQELDQMLIDDLVAQSSSYNDENISIAGKVIPTIDYTQHPHLLWRFAQEWYPYSSYFKRNKDVQHWMDKSQIRKYYNASAEGMILLLEEEDRLDATSFRYLEPIVRKEIRIDNRNLYVFKVAVKPEYRKFLKSKK